MNAKDLKLLWGCALAAGALAWTLDLPAVGEESEDPMAQEEMAPHDEELRDAAAARDP